MRWLTVEIQCVPEPELQRFDRTAIGPWHGVMEVNISPELQLRLSRIAAERGRNSDSLVSEAVERFVGHEGWFVREVDVGIGVLPEYERTRLGCVLNAQ